jgi:nucleotide-binding universal stress UspA family protein
VELLQVVDPVDILTTAAVSEVLTPSTVRTHVQLAREYLADAAKRFRRVRPVATSVREGSPIEMIAQYACAGSFDLIVMSSQGLTGLTAAVFGSVARSLVRESAIPVLILRAGAAPPEDPRGLNALVPLDGSALAEGVLAPLVPLATALGWRLLLFYAADLGADGPSQEDLASIDRRVREQRPDMVAYLERLAADLRAKELQVDVRLGSGERGPSIVRLADEGDVDLVAMSTHGRHGVGRLVLGSVTEHVVNHASKPVLAVRPLEATVGGSSGAPPSEGSDPVPSSGLGVEPASQLGDGKGLGT